MKKALLILGATALLATSAHAFSGSITAGMESTQYVTGSDQAYSRADKLVPYLKLSVTPFPGNRLRIDAAYHNTQEYNKYKATNANGRFRTGEEQFEMIFRGYQYRNGAFRFQPRAGFRLNTYDINEARLSSASQVEERVQYRFYPEFDYAVNRQTQLYFGGWVGPETYRTKGRGRTESSESASTAEWAISKGRTYTNNWKQEMEIFGVRHTFANRNRIWTSLYNERSYQDYNQKYNRWQYRVGGDYRATDNLVLKPYVRVDLDYKQTNIAGNVSETQKVNNGDQRSREAIRIAMAADYRIDSDWSLTGEVYWNIEDQSKYDSSAGVKQARDPYRKAWFYSLGVTRRF